MADVSDPEIHAAIASVRDDRSPLDWFTVRCISTNMERCAFGYVDKAKLALEGSGDTGYAGLMAFLKPDKVLRLSCEILDGFVSDHLGVLLPSSPPRW